jgi:hypothetical protein
MTEMESSSDPRYTHLRTNAVVQKQRTVDRLKEAIAQLETEGRPVNTFTIKEVSGLDYMSYYRNPEALALFRMHSTHLRNEREKEQAKQHRSKRKRAKQDENLHQIKVEPRDPLLAYKKPELVAKLRTAYAERDQLKQQAYHEGAELEQRYTVLLQEHMQCGVKIAKLEAQVAEYLAFMEQFRSALRKEEHGTQQ